MCVQTYNLARSRNHFCGGKTVIITYSESECVTLRIQHAMRMRRIKSSLACPSLLYFSTLSQQQTDFRENVTEYKMCVLILSITFV